jgi:hypothetical protein
MLSLQINASTDDKPVVLVPGTVSLSEYVTRDYAHAVSYLQLNASGVTLDENIDTLQVDLYTDAQPAVDMLTFTAVPEVGSSITVSGITYTFLAADAPLYTADNQVLLGGTTFTTALNFYRAFNALGVSGIDYHIGQTAHPTVEAVLSNDSLLLVARTPGEDGNYLTATVSGTSNIVVAAERFYNGASGLSSVTTAYECSVSGMFDGPYYLGPVSYNDIGYPYAGTATLWKNGVEAVTSSGLAMEYTLSTVNFIGRTALTEFAEVSGLSAANLYAGKVASDGTLMLTWSGMSLYQEGGTLPLGSPNTAGLPTQDTRTYTADELAHTPEYAIFVFVGVAIPDCTWPRTTEAYGDWYFAGRTVNPWAVVQIPTGYAHVGIWVGYGNRGTWDTTVTPFRKYRSDVFIT